MKLGASDIKETFTGSRIELDTPLGTTIPIRFTGDGLMSGSAGSLASVLGAANDRGRWWVKGDRLCYKWFRWFEAEEQCLTVHLKDTRVFWRRDDGKNGTATIVERPVIAALPAASNAPPKAAKVPSVPRSAAVAPRATIPMLKSPPRLAERPPSAAERLALPEEAPASRGLFFVGLGLARALQSEFTIASAEAATLPGSSAKRVDDTMPVPVRKPLMVASVAKPAIAPSAPTAELPPAELPVASDEEPVSFSVYGVEDGDVLNMRAGPSEYHAIVGIIPPRANGVRMVGRCIGLWCEIQFRDTRGWVNRYYLAQN